jgi:hypothetical protein
MRKIALAAALVLFACSAASADGVKGTIENVNIKAYFITVNGRIVDVSKATVFTQNDMGVTKTIIIRDLKDHKGEYAVCYGSLDKDNVFSAYKVKVVEGHR